VKNTGNRTMQTTILTTASLLAENTIAPLRAVVDVLRSRTDLRIEYPDDEVLHDSDSLHVWNNDLVWACGLLSVNCIASGQTEADIIAAPVFTGEMQPLYRSMIVGRQDFHDERPLAIAINERESWPGHHAYRHHIAGIDKNLTPGCAQGEDATIGIGLQPDRRFDVAVVTGSHRASLMAVATGQADRAAIDSSLWHYWTQVEPELLVGLTVVGMTCNWPAPPFVLSRSVPGDTRTKLIDGLLSISQGDVPGLNGIVSASIEQYRPLLILSAD